MTWLPSTLCNLEEFVVKVSITSAAVCMFPVLALLTIDLGLCLVQVFFFSRAYQAFKQWASKLYRYIVDLLGSWSFYEITNSLQKALVVLTHEKWQNEQEQELEQERSLEQMQKQKQKEHGGRGKQQQYFAEDDTFAISSNSEGNCRYRFCNVVLELQPSLH